MEEINDAISGSNNQQPVTTVSSMTAVTHVTPITSTQIVDDFEPDPKCEITTLEKASFETTDMSVDKLIDNIVDLGGGHQFASSMDQRGGIHDKEKEVEHIQREITGDRIPVIEETKSPAVEQEQNDTNQHNDEQHPEVKHQDDPKEQQEQAREESNVESEKPESASIQISEQQSDLKLQNDVPENKITTIEEQPPAAEITSTAKDEVHEDQTPNDFIKEISIDNQPDWFKTDTFTHEEQVVSVEEKNIEENTALKEEKKVEPAENPKDIVEEEKNDEEIEKSVVESIEREECEDDKSDDQDLIDKPEEVESKTEPEVSEPVEEKVVEEKVEEEQSVSSDLKPTPKKRGRKPKSQASTPKVEEIPVERPRRTRGSVKPPPSPMEAVKEPLQEPDVTEKVEDVGMDVKIDKKSSESEVIEHQDEVHNEAEGVEDAEMSDAEEETKDEPKKEESNMNDSRSVRVRFKKQPFQLEVPKAAQEKPPKRSRLSKPDTPFERAIDAPKLKLPARTRTTICTNEPSRRPERRNDMDDFGLRKYRCDLCRFSTDRLNTIVDHQKSAACDAARKLYDSHVQASLFKLQSPKSNKKRFSK